MLTMQAPKRKLEIWGRQPSKTRLLLDSTRNTAIAEGLKHHQRLSWKLLKDSAVC